MTLSRLPVTVLLDNIRSAYNVGAFFRTADAVALDRLLLTELRLPSHAGNPENSFWAEEPCNGACLGSDSAAPPARNRAGARLPR